jgi:DMSO/TMAO reductase YedYZ molybdopterin-dependent catalytic subunit
MPSLEMSRRSALAQVGRCSVAAMLGLASTRRAFADPALCRSPTDAGMVVRGKNSVMKVVESKPIVLETPLAELAKAGPTATEVLFVRNNQDLDGAASLDPVADDNWSVEIRGLIGKLRRITLGELKKLPAHSVEMVLQCSGNSRYRFAETVAVKGTPWGDGGMGNVRFAGPKLSGVLASLGLEPEAAARFVTAGGADQPAQYKGDFEHSLPLAHVLDRSILAVSLNDKPLPAIHGGPVRLVTPGYFGTMQVKWLTSLEFVAEESTSDSHAVRYRMPNVVLPPGSEFKYSPANSRSGWLMNVKSVMLLQNGLTFPAGKPLALQGVAFNDGACPIEAVLVSTNRGQSWVPAKLTPAASNYAWSRWTIDLDTQPGTVEVWSRAIDELGRTQPLDGRRIWNPAGYEFNAVDKRVVTFA